MHYNDLKHALYNTHFCFFIFFALFRWMQSESIRFTCVQWYVKIQQVRASTSKHIMIYDDIWWYISIARALENWLTQETTREPRGRRIREGSVLNRPLLALPGLYQVVQILWISMMFDDIWWYLMIFEYRWCLHISHDVFTCLQTFTVCLPMFVYPCISMYSKQINVYPCISLIREAVGTTCIHLNPCYIFYIALFCFIPCWFIFVHHGSSICTHSCFQEASQQGETGLVGG
jgi:hypothetical protein